MKAPFLSNQWFDLVSTDLEPDLSLEYFKIGFIIKNSPYGDISYQVGLKLDEASDLQKGSTTKFYVKRSTQDFSIPNLIMDYFVADRIFSGHSSIAAEITHGEIKLYGNVTKLTELNYLHVDFDSLGSLIQSVTEFKPKTLNPIEVLSQEDLIDDLTQVSVNSLENILSVEQNLTDNVVSNFEVIDSRDKKEMLLNQRAFDSRDTQLNKDIHNSQHTSQGQVHSLENEMEILSSRILLRPSNLQRSIKFYRDDLGLAVFREFGEGDSYGIVFYLGGGFLEVSGTGSVADPSISIWLQVRDIKVAADQLKANNILITKGPTLEPWGLIEMWVSDPDGVRLYFVEVPDDHPMRLRTVE